MAASIFLSHASKDKKIAETICSALEGRGLDCWMATRDVHPGENFQESIVRAIRAAKVMLFVFSANSNNSDEVKKEIALAGSHKLFVIPVRVEDVAPNEALAYEFATRQWIDLFSDWEEALDQLTVQIEAVTALQTSTPSEPSAERPRRARRAATPTISEAAAAPTTAAVETERAVIEVDALYELANTHAKAGEYDLAIEQYDRVLEEKPDHTGALNNRGNAYHAKGLDDQALADFDRAISLKPDFAAAYCNRGNVLQGKGEYDRAVRDYTVALQLQPDFAVALDNRARVYERKGLHDMARKDRAAASALRAGAGAQAALRATTPTAGSGAAAAPGGATPTLAGLSLTGNNRMFLFAGAGLLGLLLVTAVVVSLLKPHPLNLATASSSAVAADSSASADSGAATTSVADANTKGDAAFQAKDYAGAMKWYRIAADQGDGSAQYNVGWLYDNGDGVAQDYVQAQRYYLLAANQGQEGAQNNLGELYYYGHGVAQDYSQALHWYNLAAAQGSANAEFSLGWLYANGQGVNQDMGEARIWMTKSAAQGKDDAKTWLAQHPG